MTDSDVSQIKDRLTRLEVQFEEKFSATDKKGDARWEAHDKRSDERWTDLMDKVHELSHKTTPCNEHLRVMSEQNGRIKNLELWVDKAGWAIGVIYVTVVGTLIKYWAKI